LRVAVAFDVVNGQAERRDDIHALARLAGFFAVVGEQVEEVVAQGRKMLDLRDADALRGVLVYDGYMTLPAGKTDALFIEARSYERECGLDLAVPYRNAVSDGGFAVYRPKFQHVEPEATDFGALGAAFFEGVDAHEEAAEVWNSQLDQSQ
jgi:hypothetical protein